MGIKCMRQSRLISIVEYWEKVSSIKDNTMKMKQAFLMMLQDRREDRGQIR